MIILKTFKYRNIEIQETADAWICSQNKKLLEEPVGWAASVRRRGNADISGWNPASREWRREITKNARGEGKVWDGQRGLQKSCPSLFIAPHSTPSHPSAFPLYIDTSQSTLSPGARFQSEMPTIAPPPPTDTAQPSEFLQPFVFAAIK